MNDNTISLLKECNAGCKMATNSMEQVKPYIDNGNFKAMVDDYNKKHIEIGDTCHKMLNDLGKVEKDPQNAATLFSWASTELKLKFNENDGKIADLLVDGTGMGIKSVSKYINEYKGASIESLDLAHKLVKTEQNFQNDLLNYL